ncbi:MAG: ATP-binding protein [Candidatus Saccharibacteria bacterium]
MSSIKQDIQRRTADYLRFTRYARWIMISVVILSLVAIPGLPIMPIVNIMAAAIIYTVLCYFGEKNQWDLITNRPLILLIDTISAVALVVLTGGENSIFIPVMLFMVVSGAYWYGAGVATAITATELIFMVLGDDLIDGTIHSGWPTIIRFMIFGAIGLYSAWLTGSTRSERTELLSISTESEQQRQQLLALINTMTDAVLVSDSSGRIVLSNKATSNFIDSAKIVHGAFVEGLMKFTDTEGKAIGIKLKSVKDGLERRDLKLITTDGSTVVTMLTITPYTVDSQSKGFIIILRDITREHTIEQERTEFIAVAQHELRTPLTVAEGAISTVLEPAYQPKDPLAREMLQMGFRSLRQLSHIVTDLTTLSQAQSEQLNPDVESINITDIYNDLTKEFAAQAKEKGLTLTVSVPATIKPIITSRYMVYEIMSNFMNNAIKFSDQGTIELIATPKGDDGSVRLSVKDMGCGISTGDQKKLFTNFFQSEDWQTRNHGGTGLGLFISKKLAKRLTAEVSFESKLGKGSTFTLDLPPFSSHVKDQTKVAKAETIDFFKYL